MSGVRARIAGGASLRPSSWSRWPSWPPLHASLMHPADDAAASAASPALGKRLKRLLLDLLGLRPMRQQVAALCLRGEGEAQQVLLVPSRDSGRWLLPKGWPMRGRGLAGSALQEAWEEAGVRGRVHPQPVGRYQDIKRSARGGPDESLQVLVFRVDQVRLHDVFPEAGQRQRTWASPAEAANMVNDGSLAAFLRRL